MGCYWYFTRMLWECHAVSHIRHLLSLVHGKSSVSAISILTHWSRPSSRPTTFRNHSAYPWIMLIETSLPWCERTVGRYYEYCRKLPQTNPCLNTACCERQQAEFSGKNIKWVPETWELVLAGLLSNLLILVQANHLYPSGHQVYL